MPSHPKKDKGYVRCIKCKHQGHWVVCTDCKGGSLYEKKPQLIDSKQRLIEGFQQDKKSIKPISNNITSDDFQQSNTDIQQLPPPGIISGGTLTERIFKLMMLGFPLHYSQVAEVLEADKASVGAMLLKASKNDNSPIIKALNTNGGKIVGTYMVDPGDRLELELLDAVLKFHNLRFYPTIARQRFQQFLWEGGTFPTLIQHLPSLYTTRADGSKIWNDNFLGRKVVFVQSGNNFHVEVSATHQPLDIPMLWELIQWLFSKFGNDTFRFDWDMSYEANQDLTCLDMSGGMVEVNKCGRLYRAYQKASNDGLGGSVLRVETGRSESHMVKIVDNGRVEHQVVNKYLNDFGTLAGGLAKQKEQNEDFIKLKDDVEKVLSMNSEILQEHQGDRSTQLESNIDLMGYVKAVATENKDIRVILDEVLDERKILYEALNQNAINQTAIIEVLKSLKPNQPTIKPDDTDENEQSTMSMYG